MSSEAPVSVNILDREFLIGCTPEEKPGLIAAASYLDAKMREIRTNARSAGVDRIAVMAALNMANELLRLRKNEGEMNAVTGRVKNMRERVESALQRTRQLDL